MVPSLDSHIDYEPWKVIERSVAGCGLQDGEERKSSKLWRYGAPSRGLRAEWISPCKTQKPRAELVGKFRRSLGRWKGKRYRVPKADWCDARSLSVGFVSTAWLWCVLVALYIESI